jgi:hypothetical protein
MISAHETVMEVEATAGTKVVVFGHGFTARIAGEL